MMNEKRHKKFSIVCHVALLLAVVLLLARQGDRADADNSQVGRLQLVSSLSPRALLPPFLEQAPMIPSLLRRRPIPNSKEELIVHPIKIGLFSRQMVRWLNIEGEHGLLVNGKKIDGMVSLYVNRNKIVIRQDGRNLAQTDSVHIIARQAGGLDLTRPGKGSRRTKGELRITLRKNALKIINTLDLDDYLMGIVEPELGSLQLPPEVLKAQLIASRSYILASGQRHGKEGYDFCDSPHCQVYRGSVHYPLEYLSAAISVRGVYLSYEGRPAVAFFHHSSGGSTAAIEDVWPVHSLPYLQRVIEGPDQGFPGVDRDRWHFTASNAAMRKCLTKAGWISKGRPIELLVVTRMDPSGRARQILIQGGRTRFVPTDDFRHAVNQYYSAEVLRSTLFTITSQGDKYVFEGKGWGHGVGMSQSGAIQMARHGKSYQQILAHYYPSTHFSRLKN